MVEDLDEGDAYPTSTTTCTCRTCGVHVEVREEVLDSLARDLLSRRKDCRQPSPPSVEALRFTPRVRRSNTPPAWSTCPRCLRSEAVLRVRVPVSRVENGSASGRLWMDARGAHLDIEYERSRGLEQVVGVGDAWLEMACEGGCDAPFLLLGPGMLRDSGRGSRVYYWANETLEIALSLGELAAVGQYVIALLCLSLAPDCPAAHVRKLILFAIESGLPFQGARAGSDIDQLGTCFRGVVDQVLGSLVARSPESAGAVARCRAWLVDPPSALAGRDEPAPDLGGGLDIARGFANWRATESHDCMTPAEAKAIVVSPLLMGDHHHVLDLSRVQRAASAALRLLSSSWRGVSAIYCDGIIDDTRPALALQGLEVDLAAARVLRGAVAPELCLRVGPGWNERIALLIGSFPGDILLECRCLTLEVARALARSGATSLTLLGLESSDLGCAEALLKFKGKLIVSCQPGGAMR